MGQLPVINRLVLKSEWDITKDKDGDEESKLNYYDVDFGVQWVDNPKVVPALQFKPSELTYFRNGKKLYITWEYRYPIYLRDADAVTIFLAAFNSAMMAMPGAWQGDFEVDDVTTACLWVQLQESFQGIYPLHKICTYQNYSM